MQESETVHPNDTTRSIRKVAENLKAWDKSIPDNAKLNRDYFIRVLEKLEEAELLSMRMIKDNDGR